MKRTAAISVALVFSLVGSVFAAYDVADEGLWPKTWPKDLEPLRKQARTLEGRRGDEAFFPRLRIHPAGVASILRSVAIGKNSQPFPQKRPAGRTK